MAVKKPSEEIVLPLVIKPDFFIYFLGGALALIFWLPLIVGIILQHWDWKLFVFSIGITSFIFILIHGCRITLNEVGVKYTRMFFWSRFMPYNQMEKCDVETSIFRSKGRPTFSLVIKAPQDTLTINIKLFSRKALSRLMVILFTKIPNAHFDERCEKMREGFMPSLLGHKSDEKNCAPVPRFWIFYFKNDELKEVDANARRRFSAIPAARARAVGGVPRGTSK